MHFPGCPPGANKVTILLQLLSVRFSKYVSMENEIDQMEPAWPLPWKTLEKI